jgi:hypothetical protein
MFRILRAKVFFFLFITNDKKNMPAEFVGIKNILKNLSRFDLDGIAVFRGKEEPFRRYAEEGESKEDIIEAFSEWCEDMLENNPNNFAIYKVQLYEYPQGAKKRKGTTAFSFQLTEQPTNNPFTKKENTAMSGEFVHKDTMLLAIENANLKNKNEALESRLNDLENRFDTLGEEEEEETPIGMIGALEQAVQEKMPMLIDVLIGMLAQPKTMPISAALGSNIDEIISEFKTINPDIESDLFKLLQIAKTKPDLFKMLITQLRSM